MQELCEFCWAHPQSSLHHLHGTWKGESKNLVFISELIHYYEDILGVARALMMMVKSGESLFGPNPFPMEEWKGMLYEGGLFSPLLKSSWRSFKVSIHRV